MRKAKLVGKRMIEICREDFKEAPEADEVLIQVKAVGICGPS